MLKYFILFSIIYSCLVQVYAYNLAKPEWFLQKIENKHKSELAGLSRIKRVLEPTMVIKQYKDTSTYIVASLYNNKIDSGVILLALIDNSSKKVLTSTTQKIEIFDDSNSIKVDLSYDNISKNLSFAIILSAYAQVTPSYLRKEIYLYDLNNLKIRPLLSKFLIEESHFLRGAGCYMNFNEIRYTRYLKNNKKDNNTIYFSGYYKHTEKKYKTQDISNNCFPEEEETGKLNIRLQLHNGRYEITKKAAIVNNSSFKNLYQISKISQVSIEVITKLNPSVKAHKLKLGTEIKLPFKNN
jgi:hypothetical protein